MTRDVTFSFDTLEEKQEFIEFARRKGITLSALARFATYQYRAKYPVCEKVSKRGRPRSKDVQENQDCTVTGNCGEVRNA